MGLVMPKKQIDEGRGPSPPQTTVESALLRSRTMFHDFLVRRLGSVDAADDVFQDFYLRAVAKGSELKKDESVISWLYRVLRSTLVDYLRKEQRRLQRERTFAGQPLAALTDDWSIWTRFEAELHAVICECFYEILPTLKPEYRDVLWRIDFLGEPRRVVAQSLGIETNTLAVRLHRARGALRETLLRVCQTCPEHGFEACSCDRREIAAQVRRRSGSITVKNRKRDSHRRSGEPGR